MLLFNIATVTLFEVSMLKAMDTEVTHGVNVPILIISLY